MYTLFPFRFICKPILHLAHKARYMMNCKCGQAFVALWLFLFLPVFETSASITKGTPSPKDLHNILCDGKAGFASQDDCKQERAKISFDKVLSENDIRSYRALFDLQEKGEWQLADQIIGGIKNPVLMGHVLYQRYMHPRLYRSKFNELNQWLYQYGDHPGNVAIRKLALKRRPSKGTFVYPLRHPADKSLRTSPSFESRLVKLPYKAQKLRNKVRSMVQSGYVTVALKQIEEPQSRKNLGLAGYALSLGDIARGYYRYHKWDKAIAITRQLDSLPVTSAKGDVLEAYWWGGLSAWQKKEFTVAAEFFEKFAQAHVQGEQEKAKGYYWAALSLIMAGFPDLSSAKLHHGCIYSLYFYGYLSCEALAIESNNKSIKHRLPDVRQSALAKFSSAEAIVRARALIEVGKMQLAIKELKPFATPYINVDTLKSMTLLAEYYHIPYMHYLAARSILKVTGNAYIPALYPQPQWEPKGGFQIDKAILYGMIRQESHFNPYAKSYKKASGLMQVMPSTAAFIGGKKYREQSMLYDPQESIHLGQNYLTWLLDLPSIDDNLLRGLIAYNGGPGNLKIWQKKIANSGFHPLLYIESLPPRETRNYVKSVLMNVWMYRDLMQQSKPTLSSILNGQWPMYMPLDPSKSEVTAEASPFIHH